MACIVSPSAASAVTDLVEVCSSKQVFNEKDHEYLDISKDIQKQNDEQVACSQECEENIEENLRNVICDSSPSSGEESCYRKKKLKNKETSSIINKIHLSDGINSNEVSSNENELQVNDKRSCDADNSNNTVKKMSKRSLSLMDSDSAEETNLDETLNSNCSTAEHNEYHSGSPKYLQQIVEHKNTSEDKSLRRIIDSESGEDTQTSESNNCPQTIRNTISTTAESYRALIDSESEEEKQNEENNTSFTHEEISESKDAKKKLVKKKKDSIRASKREAMRQIHSETQRLLRETEISLPYHRPKQRTLQEFLNRKKILTALPKAPSTVAKLKISPVIVSQVLAEKEKEAELFYKSSDSEDDMQSCISKNINKSFITNREKMLSKDIDHTQDPKRIGASIEDSENNKKEIVQKDHLDLNTLRCKVLLEKDSCKVAHQAVKLTSSLTNNNGNLDDESNTLLLQQINECNQNLPKLNLPRKLFDTSFENESNDISVINLNDHQKIIKGTVETAIISLNKEKCINKNEKSKIMVENHIFEISKAYQNNSEEINRKDKNEITEAMEISRTSNSINSKEITETFQSNDNDVLGKNVICSNSNDCIIIEDNKNNEKSDNCSETYNASSFIAINEENQSKIQHNSLTNGCEKSGHVQGLPLPKFANETLSNTIKKLSVFNSEVTLKGSPGMIIDLTDNAKPNVKGVNTLLDRFFCKHVNIKKQNDNKPDETVIHLQNTQNSLPIKELLPYKIPVSMSNPELNKPGAKLMRLKEDLKLQMILKRNKDWKQKVTEVQAQEKKEWSEEEENDVNEQEKAELSFESSDSEESEPEENDICIKDKKKSKCLFADDEAEVTDNEDSSIEETRNESDTDCVTQGFKYRKYRKERRYMNDYISQIKIHQQEKEEENDDDNNDDGDDGDVDDDDDDDDDDESKEGEEKEESLDANMENRNKSDVKNDIDFCKSFGIVKDKNDRKTRQLTEELRDDSNITSPNYLRNDDNQLDMATDIDAYKAHCEDNDWISENGSNTSTCQQHAEAAMRSQICKTPLMKASMLDLVSPITQLSVLNSNLDFNEKDSSEKIECLIDKHGFSSMKNRQNEPSERVCNIRNKIIFKKKLFDDIAETIDDDYLMQLCSGKFESTQRPNLDLSSQSNITEVSQLSCPGESELHPKKLIDIEQLKNPKVNDKMLQDIKSILDEDSNSINHAEEINEVNAIDTELKLRVISSDDEADEDTFVKKMKIHSIKKFNLSDSEEENSQFSDEVNDDVKNEEVEEQYVDYDSEENEVMVVPEKDIKQVAASFLEEEAELSESDWDSSDEDEKDLNKLEFEEADDDYIDEHEAKDQLEKIRMKQMLDEDKREIRLLKELLFEDGDLHTDGTGRERKFKWKNIDKLGNNIEMLSQMSDENDGWIDMQEDEEEAKWSKLRHERDKFLEERMKCLNNEIDDELCDSQIFKLGLEAVRKIKENDNTQRQDISFDKVDLSENMEPIMPRNITDLLNGSNIGKKSQAICNIIKKRSLLTRGEESLARIASLVKQGDSVSHAVNTRNFVFPHIDQSTVNTLKKENEMTADLDSQPKPGKRKIMSNVSSASKKRRK